MLTHELTTHGLIEQDLVKLYMLAVRSGGKASKAVMPGNGSASASLTDLSKMTPAEKKKEMARRRAQAQKEKARTLLCIIPAIAVRTRHRLRVLLWVGLDLLCSVGCAQLRLRCRQSLPCIALH